MSEREEDEAIARYDLMKLTDKRLAIAAEYQKDGETCTTGLIRGIIEEFDEDGWLSPHQRGILIVFILERDHG